MTTDTKINVATVSPIKSNGATKPAIAPASVPAVPVAPTAPATEKKSEATPAKVVELLQQGHKPMTIDQTKAPVAVAPAKPAPPVKAKELGKAEVLSVSCKSLKAALLYVSTDDARGAMCGVRFCMREGRVEMVAVDGVAMLVQAIPLPSSTVIPKWVEQGVTFDSERLISALKIAPKDSFLSISFGENHTSAVLDPTDWCSIKVRPIDKGFPDYGKIIAESGASFIGGEVDPMSIDGALAPDQFKRLGQVTLALEAKGAIPHVNRANGPTVFTFGNGVDAVLYVMPIKMDVAVSKVAAAMLAKPLAMSIAALKGHISLYTKKLPSAKGDEKLKIERKMEDLQARLANINVKPLLGKTVSGGDVKEVAPKVVRQAAKAKSAK